MNILRSDSGFAPNPFHGICTLACCRPVIRRGASVGDWVIGVTPKHLGNDLAYAMRITDAPIPFGEYFQDRRFAAKKPRKPADGAPFAETCGDNCYELHPDGTHRQHPCAHNGFADDEDLENKKWDLSGKFVLVSREFAYFGAEPWPLDKRRYGFMIPARYNRVKFAVDEEQKILDLLATLPRGIHARPRGWRESEDDSSWRDKRRCR